MRGVLLGPPGAGKGTIAAALKEELNVDHVSTGDILRDEMKSESDLGRQIRTIVEKGDLVPDTIVNAIIESRLRSLKDRERGFLLDGFPRTRGQAEALDEILNRLGLPLDYAFYLEASLPVIIQRLTGRRICRQCGALYHMKNRPPKQDNRCDICGGELYQRPDDNEETIRNRMDVYLSKTTPIIEYYESQGKLRRVDSNHDAKETIQEIKMILNGQAQGHNHQDGG